MFDILDFNFEYYKVFYHVAQLKSVTKAAEALFLTQPAISHSIRQLEKHVDCTLFVRTPKGMLLTREGELLFSHVSIAFKELLAGQRELNLIAKNVEATLKIGITETALHYCLLPKIEKFVNHYPNVYISATGSSTPENVQLLNEGKIDLAVAVSPVESTENIDVLNISEFCDIFVAGHKYAELSHRHFTPKEIYEYPMVAVENGTSARNHINCWFSNHGIFFSPKYNVRTSTAILPFVEYNLAIGIVPSMFAEALMAQGKIFELKVEPKISPRQIVLISKPNSRISPLSRVFIEYFK
ncbi:MAG: LysR family transcriptional regulator [Defluviitaleaceae bacterium]|nr:LysR family transcriptional regulator [Defluviitaleaceae bacterium]